MIPEYPIRATYSANMASRTLNNITHAPCQYAVQRHTPANVKLASLLLLETTKTHKKSARTHVTRGGTA